MNDFIYILIAIAVTILATGAFIPILKKKNYGQQIREEGNKEHYKKSGTPTMGGLAFTLVFLIITAIATNFNKNVLFVILGTFLFGLIGFLDDFEKIAKKQSLGLNEKQKLILQFGISFILIILEYFLLDTNLGNIEIPFINYNLHLGIFSIPLLMFIMVGTVNATNLTDGLDGLLGSVSIPVFLGIGIMSLINFPEISASAFIFVGVLLGFLIYNSYPASIFMGDTGSMAIGGAIASMLIIINKPIHLAILGGVFVLEALSVIIQRFSYKKFNKRVFLMSPIHHHFELKGFKEPKIVMGFTVLSTIFTILTLLS